MKAVKTLNHVFIRNQNYYFRFNFPRKFLSADIRISLNTKNLVYALQRIEILAPLTNELKALAMAAKNLSRPTLKQRIVWIKESMRKELTLHNIDLALGESEKNVSNHIYMMDILSDVSMQDLPDETLKQLAEVMLTEDYDLMQKKVTAYSNSSDSFQRGLSLIAKVATLQTVTVNNADTAINNGEFGQGVDEVSRIIRHSDALKSESQDITPTPFVQEAEALLQRLGYDYQVNSIPFKVLSKKLASSRKLKNQLAIAIIQGDVVKERELEKLLKNDLGIESIQTTKVELQPDSPLLSEVYEEFLDYKIKKENLTSKMQKDYERYWIVWSAIAPDKPILEYKPRDIGSFIDRCFELPKMNKSPYNKMNWDERLNCDVLDEDLATPKTVQQYYKLLQGVFAFAKKDTIGYITASPCNIKRDFKQRRRGIYFDEEVRAFITFANVQKECWKKWSILLGIYTGARRSEIFQLRKEDIKKDLDSERYYLLITDEHETQKLKTENSKRRIPLHNELIQSGFLTYVSSCNERILEEITNAETITRWFAKVVEQLDISTTNEIGDMRSFHSFRHTFITKIRTEGKFDLSLLQQIVGHEISKAGITDNYTHGGASIARLANVVDTFSV
jgi:integrase